MTKKVKNYNEIKENGLYFSKVEFYDVEGTYVINRTYKPLIFKKNGFVYSFGPIGTNDTMYFINAIQQNKVENYRWGVYEISGKTITAIIPTGYYKRGLVIDYKLSKYEGVLVTPDSITNWRMIPPFPLNIDKGLNQIVLSRLQKSLSCSYYKNNIVLQADTVGAWFNKFIKK
jgi:hypothetical protein